MKHLFVIIMCASVLADGGNHLAAQDTAEELFTQSDSSIAPPQEEQVIVDTTVSSEAPVAAVPEPVSDTATFAPALEQPKASTVVPADDTIQSLDKMVVSATRTRRKMSETPASVTVISRKEIESSPAKDINDLVANKTSVQVRRPVGMGEGVPSDISMRGIPGALAAARTLILVDGIPTNASGTPFLILNEIPVEIIDNIEIVRGPYSSLYGANAFGGVINVITKKGDGAPRYGAMVESSYPFSVLNAWNSGERIRKAAKTGRRQALWNGDVMSSGGNDRINYLVNAGYRTIGNYLLSDSALVKTTNVKYYIPAKNYDYSDTRLFGKLGVRINERLTAELHTRYFKSDLGFGVTRYSPDTNDIDIKGEKIVVGPQFLWKATDNIDVKAGGYFRHVNGSYMNEMDKKPVAWKSSSNDYQIDLQSVMRLFPGHVFTVGSEFLSNAITFGDLVNSASDSVMSSGVNDRISNAGAYIQDEITLWERLRIVPGIRMDYHTVFGIALSPKLGVSFTANEMVHLRGSAGRAFRAPNHTELFMPPLPLKDSITLVANPDVKPEYIGAFDAGVDVTPVKNIKLQGGVFYNSMQDLIGQGIVLTDEFDIYVTHQNISKAWSAGVEFDAEVRLRKELTVKGGYVYQQSRNESASDVAAYFKENDIGLVTSTDIELDYVPHHKASIGIVGSHQINRVKMTLSVDEMFVGKRHYLDFSHARMGVGGVSDISIDPNTKEVKVAPPYETLPYYFRTDLLLRCDVGRYFGTLAVQNLFDAEFEESYGTLAPGMLATVKVGVEF